MRSLLVLTLIAGLRPERNPVMGLEILNVVHLLERSQEMALATLNVDHPHGLNLVMVRVL